MELWNFGLPSRYGHWSKNLSQGCSIATISMVIPQQQWSYCSLALKFQTTVSIFFNISLNIRKSKVNWKMIFCERKCMKTLLRILEKVIITKNGVTAILHYTDYRQDWARFVPLLVSCSYNVLKTKIMNENDKSSLRGDGRPSFKWTVHVIV